MDLCEGGDLQQLLHSRGRLELATARNLFRQLAESLLYLHKRNICHRDLKLSNLLLVCPAPSDTSLRVQIADFGLAVRTRSEQSQHTFCGTSNYLPPEVCLHLFLYNMQPPNAAPKTNVTQIQTPPRSSPSIYLLVCRWSPIPGMDYSETFGLSGTCLRLFIYTP